MPYGVACSCHAGCLGVVDGDHALALQIHCHWDLTGVSSSEELNEDSDDEEDGDGDPGGYLPASFRARATCFNA